MLSDDASDDFSDCADVQTSLNLRWAHISEGTISYFAALVYTSHWVPLCSDHLITTELSNGRKRKRAFGNSFDLIMPLEWFIILMSHKWKFAKSEVSSNAKSEVSSNAIQMYKHLSYKAHRSEVEIADIETIWDEIASSDVKPVFLCTVYHPPSSPSATRKHASIILTPLKPHVYIVKLGFTGVYIIFLISAKKHRLWVLP